MNAHTVHDTERKDWLIEKAKLGVTFNPHPVHDLGALFKAVENPHRLPNSAYTVEERTYSNEEFRKITPRTAEDSFRMLEREKHLPIPPPGAWKFTKASLQKLYDSDPFVRTLGKYIHLNLNELRDYVKGRKIPKEDMEELIFQGYDRPDSEILEHLEWDLVESPKLVISELDKSGVYYPPSVDEDWIGLDGAHRVSAMHLKYGGEPEIYLWRYQPEQTTGNPGNATKGGAKDVKSQNDHPVHDLGALFKVAPTPQHAEMPLHSTNGVVNGDPTDMIFDNDAVIRKSMEMTGVGDMIRNTLAQLDGA